MEIPKNPYFIGGSVGDGPAFVGRADILRDVLDVLRHDNQNAIVLHGQRRIGKTSVLKQLEARLPKEGDFLPVFFDLQDKSGWPLEKVLRKLADKINECLPNKINPDLGKEPEKNFRELYIPNILKELASEQSLVLFFDEFDVLAASDKIEQPASAAFFPYLRELLILNSQQLNFVFAIGRKIEDVNNIALSLFKDIFNKRVSLLEKDDTIKLIRLSETNKTLNWLKEAIETVWQQTHGHPYLTQCLCYCIWNMAYEPPSKQIPHITPENVIAAIPETLELSESAFEWLWDGLGYADRVVAVALAKSTKPLTDTQIKQVLKENGLQIIFQELRDAPHILQKWDLIEPTEGGYCFRVELLRRWIADNKLLYQEQEELDRLDPEADKLYETAKNLYKRPNLDAAIDSLYQAININQRHVGAHLLLADIFIEKRQFEKAYEILELLYDYQPLAAREHLIEVLLILGRSSKNKEEQRKLYERVLEIEPEHGEAKRILQTIKGKKDKMSSKEQLVHLFNNIVEDDNEIDAVFVTQTQESIAPILLKNTSEDGKRTVNIDSFATQVSKFSALLNKMKLAETGNLEYAFFLFTQGITTITCLGQNRQVFLFMVSAATEGIAELDFYRRKNLPDIQRHLKEAGFID
jgi:tetratricopeptide (TPR) repeat protein